MSSSAHTTTIKSYNSQVGNVGTKKTVRATITFGADYASTVLPLITADELGLSQVHAVIPEGGASGTAAGAGVVVAKSTGGDNFTLKLFNGTTAIGTVDESGTTVDIFVLGN